MMIHQSHKYQFFSFPFTFIVQFKKITILSKSIFPGLLVKYDIVR